MANISWSINVTVTGQLSISASAAAQPVEAVDRIAVTVEPGVVDMIVDIQPGPASAIQLLMITSNPYGSDLSFKASDGLTTSASVVLDAPQLFTNGSSVLFGLDPRQLRFSNASADMPAEVEVLVARDATPPP
jgi:hypothetical protein